jgi:hypothetical protein
MPSYSALPTSAVSFALSDYLNVLSFDIVRSMHRRLYACAIAEEWLSRYSTYVLCICTCTCEVDMYLETGIDKTFVYRLKEIVN